MTMLLGYNTRYARIYYRFLFPQFYYRSSNRLTPLLFTPAFFQRKGLSAFQYAAANGKLEFVRLLIVYGGNLAKLCPDNNHTIIDELRFRLNDQDIVNFLKSYFDSRTQTGDVSKIHISYDSLDDFVIFFRVM